MTASRQRLLALALLLVAMGLVWLIIVQPVAEAFADQQDEIAGAQQMLGVYQQRIAMRPQVEARLAELKSHETSATGLIGGASAELAAANVQNLVKALVEGQAGQVHSAQNLTPVTADGFQRIDVQYDVSLPMNHIKTLTYGIETSTPYLFLDGVDLRAPENWQAADGDAPNVEVRWTVSAYRWLGAK
ncbi:MAG TPA: type II secretion system protein GspM [Rhizomicrobium sp.]|nr:type II secretion system protein GspM [Rhizomicrobium sp.]